LKIKKWIFENKKNENLKIKKKWKFENKKKWKFPEKPVDHADKKESSIAAMNFLEYINRMMVRVSFIT